MSAAVKQLLQKINCIEADINLHKQILFSLSPDDSSQMEEILQKIASYKNQIHELRQQIKNTDKDEYNRIIVLEKAVNDFLKIAEDKRYVRVTTLNETGICFVELNDGTRLDCLVTAEDDEGNWTVLTLDGETRQYPSGLVKHQDGIGM